MDPPSTTQSTKQQTKSQFSRKLNETCNISGTYIWVSCSRFVSIFFCYVGCVRCYLNKEIVINDASITKQKLMNWSHPLINSVLVLHSDNIPIILLLIIRGSVAASTTFLFYFTLGMLEEFSIFLMGSEEQSFLSSVNTFLYSCFGKKFYKFRAQILDFKLLT